MLRTTSVRTRDEGPRPEPRPGPTSPMSPCTTRIGSTRMSLASLSIFFLKVALKSNAEEKIKNLILYSDLTPNQSECYSHNSRLH